MSRILPDLTAPDLYRATLPPLTEGLPEDEPYLLSDYDLALCRAHRRAWDAIEAETIHTIKPRSPDPSKPYTGPRFVYERRMPPIRTKRLR